MTAECVNRISTLQSRAERKALMAELCEAEKALAGLPHSEITAILTEINLCWLLPRKDMTPLLALASLVRSKMYNVTKIVLPEPAAQDRFEGKAEHRALCSSVATWFTNMRWGYRSPYRYSGGLGDVGTLWREPFICVECGNLAQSYPAGPEERVGGLWRIARAVHAGESVMYAPFGVPRTGYLFEHRNVEVIVRASPSREEELKQAEADAAEYAVLATASKIERYGYAFDQALQIAAGKLIREGGATDTINKAAERLAVLHIAAKLTMPQSTPEGSTGYPPSPAPLASTKTPSAAALGNVTFGVLAKLSPRELTSLKLLKPWFAQAHEKLSGAGSVAAKFCADDLPKAQDVIASLLEKAKSGNTRRGQKADLKAFGDWLGMSAEQAVEGLILLAEDKLADALVFSWSLDIVETVSSATRARRLATLRAVLAEAGVKGLQIPSPNVQKGKVDGQVRCL